MSPFLKNEIKVLGLILLSLILIAGIQSQTWRECIQVVNRDTVAYITRTGKKYHTADCRYLSKSKIPITFKEVIQIFPVPWISCRE